MTAISIRPEKTGDEGSIHKLTEAAFRDMPFSDGSEPRIVDALRAAGDLSLSLVAERNGQIVGHIAISPVTIDGEACDWFGLGPVSVWPEHQGQRIGAQLIRRSLAHMEARGAKGIVLLGSTDYYPRFGFEHDPELKYPGTPPQNFQRLILSGPAPRGVVTYAPAFSG